ncbi:MAG TPA: TolC family protein [Burkholderiales bacterium]|nr:TolC family protein [Burkholderiales bacterium]
MRNTGIALLSILAAGCVSFSEDGGFGTVQTAVRERAGVEAKWVRSESEADSVRARVGELLAQPLSAEAAVQIALLNNAGLQASYAEMGIAEADLVQASRWSGPKFSFARLRHGGTRDADYERGVFFDLLGLITIPLSTKAERKRFEATQTRAAGEALRLAVATRKAWFEAVAAEETTRYMEQAKEAAEAGAELARRMAAVGNWSKLNQAREQAFYAETTAQLARARHASVAAREQLTRLMGLWGEEARFVLPQRLPELPQNPREAGELEAQALAQRLDVQSARRESESLAESLGLAKVTRFVNLLEVGVVSEKEADEPRHRGFEIELRIPIFDFGGAHAARAEHQYLQSVNRAMDAAVRARSEVRETYSAYRTAFDLARHYRDEIVPLRRRISEEVLLRYNGMLMSVFELLADSREQIAAVNAYIDSLRSFWMAESDLQAVMSGSPGAEARTMRPGAAPARAGAGEH